MATVTTPLSSRPSAALSPSLATGLYRFSVSQYDQMIENRTIAEDERTELIEGLLVKKMGRNRPHVQAGNKGFWALSRILPGGWHVRKEDPIVVSEWSKPEPDLAVVRGEIADYDQRDVTAADLALVVEIAESSLSADQPDMTRVYSASGIPMYWIINLVERRVEVYSEPGPDGYQSCQMMAHGQEIAVVIGAVEIGRIAVGQMLP
jgi:Uma2 family endonuclease